MKRIYVKPLIKVVSCRPMCFIAASNPADWSMTGGGPNDIGQGEPVPDDSREFKYNWNDLTGDE